MPREKQPLTPSKPAARQLIDIGEQRSEWVKEVAKISKSAITEVFRVMIDILSVEDPESFAVKMKKFKLKMELEALEREDTARQQRKEALIKELEHDHSSSKARDGEPAFSN